MKKILPVLIVIVLAALVPVVVKNPYYLHILILGMMYIMMTEGLNLVTGYMGLLSVGHIAFLGLGAYTSALLSLNFGITPLVCMVASGLVAALFSFLLGKITLRVRGAYFVIMTTAYCEIIKLIMNNSHEVTNGPMGLRGVPNVMLFGLELKSKVSYYYFGLILVIITVYVCKRVVDSKYGRAFKAIREHEHTAASVGISFSKYGMIAAVIAGFFAGIAGSYYVHYTNYISPDIFGWSYTTTMLLMLVIGGKGTIAGPIVGSILFSFVPELLRQYDKLRLPLYGIILMVSILLMPDGIVAVAKDLYMRVLSLIAKKRMKAAGKEV